MYISLIILKNADILSENLQKYYYYYYYYCPRPYWTLYLLFLSLTRPFARNRINRSRIIVERS